MNKPKVLVTRVIPTAGLDTVREFCEASGGSGSVTSSPAAQIVPSAPVLSWLAT